jgi:hypothetical protein
MIDLVRCVWPKIASEQTFTVTIAVTGGNDDVSTGILGKEVIHKDVRCETRPHSRLASTVMWIKCSHPPAKAIMPVMPSLEHCRA